MNSFFYNIKIIYFISHEGYIPASEAPNLIDPPPLGMYTVVFFVCLFACFFPEEKNTNKPTETKVSFISEWVSSFLCSAPPFTFVVIVHRPIDFSKWLMRCS